MIAADVPRHQRTCAISFVEDFVRNLSVFQSVAIPKLVGQTWQPVCGFVARVCIIYDEISPSLLARPLWTDSDIMSPISMRQLISTLKKKNRGAGG